MALEKTTTATDEWISFFFFAIRTEKQDFEG
jgi:hypothetical protein